MRSKLYLEILEDRCVPAAVLTNISPTEAGVFHDGTWTLDTNNNHQLDASDETFVFGRADDIPITGNWNGGTQTEVGVFRDVNGVGEFILDYNGDHVFDAGDKVFYFGLGTDTPVVGDWNGAGADEVGVFRNVNGRGLFVLDTNGDYRYDANSTVFYYGLGTDTPVIGDWNGSGTSKVGVFRNVGSGLFALDTNGDHKYDAGDQTFYYGLGTDKPVAGDWAGAVRDSIGVVREKFGDLQWTLDYNSDFAFNAGDLVFNYGLSSYTPVVGQW